MAEPFSFADRECVAFLQWALPRLHLRWPGFRKVRRQVCKRIGRRVQELRLRDAVAYREYLQRHREEWAVLDGLCSVSISRFFRDRIVFSTLQDALLPELARRAGRRGEGLLRVWSAGCAGGEEPYSLKLLWELTAGDRAADARVEIEIVASDSDPCQLQRAARACYPYSSVKGIPENWRRTAFVEAGGEFCLRPPLKQGVRFMHQDVRIEAPPGLFDLVLCRNLAFTYFDDEQQRQVLRRLAGALHPQGFLVIGIHEALPPDDREIMGRLPRIGIYQKP